MTNPVSLLADIPEQSCTELFSTLLHHKHCRIERIVSFGQASPEGFWYDQAWDEWVLLVQGSAELDLGGQTLALSPGDHVFIQAGQRHRVLRTSSTPPAIWLAVHLEAQATTA